MLFSYLTH